jgi:single stranded DNA-binding protein
MYRIQRTNFKKEQYTMFNKVILIGRLGKNAEVKTAQNKKDYVTFSIATSESWKNDKGEYETRTEWHRVYAWGNLSNFARTLLKGQLISLEGRSVSTSLRQVASEFSVEFPLSPVSV